ncbi:hypothetical protein Agub_g1344 [Astrephomene gubernaculifera]|uniref:phytol kinase n=1 Tax=Astrephomene gubernaculifera TaxID=47775 RepID=A0AAD3DGA7_9CHLO|nr:hypothetical protein Agub_g1344 [Astrephomene gubernaculifera]
MRYALCAMEGQMQASGEGGGAAATEEAGAPADAATPLGSCSANVRQLALLASCAVCEWLPSLAHQARFAADKGLTEHAVVLLARVLTLLPAVALQCCAVTHGSDMSQRGAISGNSTADGAGCSAVLTAAARYDEGCAGGTDNGGSAAAVDGGGGGDGGWRHLLLAEVDVVPLLGLAMQLLEGHRGVELSDWPSRWYACELICSCCALAAACPEQVRQAAAAGAGAAAAASTAAGTAAQAVITPPWRPELLRALAAELGEAAEEVGRDGGSSSCGDGGSAVVGDGAGCACEPFSGVPSSGSTADGAGQEGVDHSGIHPTTLSAAAHAADLLAVQLEGWREGAVAGAVTGLLDAAARAIGWRGEDGALTAAVLVPPGELRRQGLLRGCGNPGCANLEGDSEAGVKLKGCGRCGTVGYCCRECQLEHWRAPGGHKEACGRAGGEEKHRC